MTLETVINTLNGYLWSPAMIVLCLGIAIYYSAIMRFPQLRLFKGMVISIRGGDSEQGITPFQAFAMALGGRIGIGAIAGVGTAIYFGGPGSVFWMCAYSILGAGTAMAESVLAQVFKEEVGGEYRGGPAYYLKKSSVPFLGVVYMVAGIISYGFTGPTIQAYNIAESIQNAFGIDRTITAAVLTALFGVVVLGGMRRIGRVAEYAVPFMAGAYMILTLAILALNISQVPGLLLIIVKSAFSMDALYGGLFGSAVAWGIRRSVYSTEAGMGSGAQAAASSEVSHPIKQGLAQAFSVYNTLIICLCTALMILCTGMFNVADGAGGHLFEGLPNIQEGIGYTQAAIDTLLPGISLGSIFIAIAIFFFAFTTLMSFGFYAVVNIASLFQHSKYLKPITLLVGCAQMSAIFLGSIKDSSLAWGIADFGVALLTWSNLIGMIFLGGVCSKCMRDYDNQLAQGLNPVFKPKNVGIRGAELWEQIVRKNYSKQ